jgi:hypothetical protein
MSAATATRRAFLVVGWATTAGGGVVGAGSDDSVNGAGVAPEGGANDTAGDVVAEDLVFNRRF